MFRTVKAIIALFALALILSPFAAADSAQITIPHNGRVTVLTLDLKRDDSVSFSWTANSSVTFQVNDILGNNFVNQQGQTGSGNWNVPADNSYLFNFRNPSDLSAASVQWTINHSTPISVTTSYLLVGLAIVLAAAMIVIWTAQKKHSPSRSQL